MAVRAAVCFVWITQLVNSKSLTSIHQQVSSRQNSIGRGTIPSKHRNTIKHPAQKNPKITKNIQKQTPLSNRNSEFNNIAVCFVGQFLRESNLSDHIRNHFNFGDSCSYHAFVTTSTQQYEEKPQLLVNPEVICNQLHSNGFQSCMVETVPYNSSFYLDAVKMLPFRLANGLFPHRMISYFSSISNCIQLIKRTNIKNKIGQNINMTHLVITRIDVIDLIRTKSLFGIHLETIFDSTDKNKIIALRRPHIIEDRLIVGTYENMTFFEHLFHDTKIEFQMYANQPSIILTPERLLYQFMNQSYLSQPMKQRKRLTRPIMMEVKKYFRFDESFHAWSEKYSSKFGEDLATHLNISVSQDQLSCSKITVPAAQGICLKHMKKKQQIQQTKLVS